LSDDLIKTNLESGGVSSNGSQFYTILADGNIQRAKYLQKRSEMEIILEMKEQIEAIVNSNSSDWRKYINGMSRLVRSDSDEFKFKLFLAQTWFLQSYRLKQNLKGSILDDSFTDSLLSFSNSFPKADYAAINSSIEETINSINKNFYMPLKLTNMLVDIQHYLQGTN